MILIEEILINGMLKDFYESYREHKKGTITNHIAGSKLYDYLIKNKIAFDISAETKKEIYRQCGKTYVSLYSIYKDYSKEAQKKIADRYYKSALMEWWLNYLVKEKDQYLELGTITDLYFKDTTEETKLMLKKMNNKLGMAIFDLSTED
jgi:hypothetical protein